MRLTKLNQIELPEIIKRILRENNLKLPFPLKDNEQLAVENVDHVAIALTSVEEFDGLCQEIPCIYPVLEKKHIWPIDIAGCPQVPVADLKYMASFKVHDSRLVLLCPYSEGDVIHNFVCHAGGAALHHLAFTVPNLASSMKRLMRDFPNIRQITPVATDSGYMSQVFFQLPNDPRIIELVQRENDFEGTFTCTNVRQLTEGERLNWRSH